MPFSLIAGLAIYAMLPDEPGSLHFFIGSLIVTLALVVLFVRQSQTGFRWGKQIGAIWLGFCLLPIHGAFLGTAMLVYPAYGTYEAVVDEVIPAGPQGRRVVISSLAPAEDARPVPVRRARLLVPLEPLIESGDRIRAKLRLAPVPGPVLPGAYDSQFHSFFSGIGAYGSAVSDFEVVARGSESDFYRRIQALRSSIGSRVDASLDGAEAAIGKAMMVGDQSGITDEIREVMAASGLAHVYSISGLHLSMVAGGIFWLVRLVLASTPLALSWPIKHVAATFGLLAAFGYLMLAGGPDNVPAFRSTLMLGLVFGAVLAGRRALTMRNVALAALVIIAVDPASVFRASFQLSFAAVVALIGVYELPRHGGSSAGGSVERTMRFVLATGWTSFVAGLATLLFSAFHFQQTAPLGVLGNLLALPFVSLIMWFGVLAVLAMPFGLEATFMRIMGWNIDRMVDVAELVVGWSAGWTGNPLLEGWTLFGGLAALAWFAFVNDRWRFLSPVLLVPLVMLFGYSPRPDVLIADTTQAVAVRDGQGLALVSGRSGSFAVDVWSQHYQTTIGQTHPAARCDTLGCIVDGGDFTVAVIRNAAAFAEDCYGQDLIVSRIRAPAGCGGGAVYIGPEDLARGGVHWLAWNSQAGHFDVRPAIGSLNRPWRVVPR